MNDLDMYLMPILQGKNEEQIEEIVLQLCDTYGLNYYQCKRYVEDLLDKMK